VSFVEMSDLGRWRRPYRPFFPPFSPYYRYPYWPVDYSSIYPLPALEETRVVDESLDPFLEEKRKAEEAAKFEALKEHLKKELKKELGLGDMGWRPRAAYNPYAAQNWEAARQRALYDSLAWQYGLLPYIPPQIVEIQKVISPQAAELDLLYADGGPHGAGLEVDELGAEDAPGAKDAGFMDGLSGLASGAAAAAGGPSALVAAAAGVAVVWWFSRRKR